MNECGRVILRMRWSARKLVTGDAAEEDGTKSRGPSLPHFVSCCRCAPCTASISVHRACVRVCCFDSSAIDSLVTWVGLHYHVVQWKALHASTHTHGMIE